MAADTAHPGIEYEAGWDDVAAYVGQVLPWWPDLLRLSSLVREWRPGAQAAVVEVPANGNEKILRRAAANESFGVTSRAAAMDMANGIRNNRIDTTSHEIEIFCKEGYGDTPNQVVPGAVPDTSQHPLPCDGDREALQAGWLGLALDTHPDAVAALEIAVGRDPDLLPFGAVSEIPAQHGTVSDRWTHRLTMCDPTAAHAVLAQDAKVEAFFIDPLTDMPAGAPSATAASRCGGSTHRCPSRPAARNSPRLSCTTPCGCSPATARSTLRHARRPSTRGGETEGATGPARPQPSSTSSWTTSVPPSTCTSTGMLPRA
ncbi:hypothetical protein [Streptomyces sp. NPDC001750]|uniref:hypothetical protein n=1 Tax=Streptomyces sp. NPDC001750 TaxID=3364607 RepID=UPI003696779C